MKVIALRQDTSSCAVIKALKTIYARHGIPDESLSIIAKNLLSSQWNWDLNIPPVVPDIPSLMEKWNAQ